MTIIREKFGHDRVVLPVIHLTSPRQAAEEARLVFGEGADGVFLIHHGCNHRMTVEASVDVRDALESDGYKSPWIGVNLLGAGPVEALDYLWDNDGCASGVWSDERAVGEWAERRARSKTDVAGMKISATIFSGVAFKGQPQPADLARAAWVELALGVDVITTSGPRTGAPCDPRKIQSLREAVGPHYGVAVASGVNEKNVGEMFAAGADAILIASSLLLDDSNDRFDRAKTKSFMSVSRRAT